jgi:thioredoxin reductase
VLDVIIVGGGPAGLAAGLTLGRALRSTLIIDSGEPRNAPASEMHNFISRDGTPPFELRRMARRELERYSTVEVRDARVVSATSVGDDGFEVMLADGTRERARRLLLATGLIDELPSIEGFGELWGRGVFHCPYCHGYEIRDQALAVLGAQTSAVQLALHVTRFSGDVVLCTNGSDEVDADTRERLATNGVTIREESIARVEGSDGHLGCIVFTDGAVLDRGAMFWSPRFRQRSDLTAQLGCTTFEDNCIEVNDLGLTSVPGVYAAGDMARRATMHGPAAAVIAAAASGTMAGIGIDKDLLGVDTAIRTGVEERQESLSSS